MKKIIATLSPRVLLLIGALTAAALPSTLRASPYASGCTNIAGTVYFYLNESGGNVTVIYEDGTTNAGFNGITTGTNAPEGRQSFSLGAHTGYAIYVHKDGSGVPSQISSDASPYSIWNTPRGLAVNQNSKIGSLFGRIYTGNGGNGGAGVSAKYHGLYAMNADQSEALGNGTNAAGIGAFAGSGTSGPYKMRVDPDNTLLVGDFGGNGAVWFFAPDLTSSNAIFLPSQPGGIHGDGFGTHDLLVTNIGGINYYTLWAFDSGMGVPAGTTLGPGTSIGSYNCAERYDVGTNFGVNPLTNPNLLYTSGPNYAYTMGLDGIAELRTEGDIGKDGKIICGFGRANLSNPNIQILDPTGSTMLWTSWNDTGGASDPWAGLNGSGLQVGTYCGVRVSPDGRFFASVDIDNGITIANLTNGLPDDASIFGIQNAPNVGSSRGMDWDAADNLYVVSSGQGLMRIWSLGLTTTCVTSNDITGTNGTFQLIVPPVTASVVATTPLASQNYVNNASPGTPIPGVFTITLTTNFLALPSTVTFITSGSAALNTNYTINTGTDAHGVLITTTNVTFPAGSYPGVGNWAANVQIVPTATPVSGPSMSVGIRLIGGANYLAGTPGSATVSIQNTGPQLLFLVTGPGTTMSRSVPGDYAEFHITRWGDTNGPGNSPGSVNPVLYTVTNFTYLGTAVFPADYTARAQRGDPAYNGLLQSPVDGSPGVVINPGDITVTAVVGNPVRHANLSAPPVNVTIIINPTNSVTGTNATTKEGYAYSVIPAFSVILTELDNALGNEVVLWSDPLTNSVDSKNWTLTFAATNMAAHPVLPVVIPNYTNDESAIVAGGTNDFRVEFGNPVANDSVPQSPLMAANGWTNALRMTVNKDGGNSQAGVNLYPQGMTFAGNYALRFSMYLSLFSRAVGDPLIGTYPFEFALFGVNHTGTNCNWRTSFSIPPNPGYAAPTNADGVWFAIDAGWGSITPADFDAFTSSALPNSGVTADYQSNNSQSQNGVFKSPPFVTEENPGPTAGGEPVNQWVDVSVEITLHTNVNVYINRSLVIPSFTLLNGGGNYINGKPMLGYLDPVPDVSDPSSAFVYYSNVRVVELAPYIYAQPASLLVNQGANVSFTSSTWLGTPSITNTWYFGTTPSPANAVQVNTANATNITSTLMLNNVQLGTNILVVASDPAGAESGTVASLEVVAGPTNQTVSAGSNYVSFVVIPSGPSAPTYQWYANGVKLANSSHYAGATASTLTITNAELSDAVTYSVVISNPAGVLTNSATLTVNAVHPDFARMSISGTNALLNFTSTDPYDNTGSFTLQSSVNVQGPYVNTAGTITGSAGAFQFTVPLTTNKTMFYRLQHN